MNLLVLQKYKKVRTFILMFVTRLYFIFNYVCAS